MSTGQEHVPAGAACLPSVDQVLLAQSEPKTPETSTPAAAEIQAEADNENQNDGRVCFDALMQFAIKTCVPSIFRQHHLLREASWLSALWLMWVRWVVQMPQKVANPLPTSFHVGLSQHSCSPLLGKLRQCTPLFRHHFPGIFLILYSSPSGQRALLASPGLESPSSCVALQDRAPAQHNLYLRPSRRCAQGGPAILVQQQWPSALCVHPHGAGLSCSETSERNYRWRGAAVFSWLFAICHL